MKRYFSWLLVLCMVLTLLPGNVFAAEIVESGTIGSNLTWTLDKNGVLTINGRGWMNDFPGDHIPPWSTSRDKITKVVISPGIVNIGCEAFCDCTNLTDVTIPTSVTRIGDSAFLNCHKLNDVILPNNVTYIGACAFYNCNSLTTFTIPNTVTSIYYDAFSGCNKLNSISISKNVSYIGHGAFSGCDSLTTIDVAKDNATYSSFNGVLFNKDKTELICFPGKLADTYTIPNCVKTIMPRAFSRCGTIRNISIPSSVNEIGDGAFMGCINLETILIPYGITDIPNNAFKGCTSLKNISIPNSVDQIGLSAFEGCSSLTSICIPYSSDFTTTIRDKAFKDCSSMTSLSILGFISIDTAAFEGCACLTDVYFYDSEQSWQSLINNSIAPQNDPLLNATIHYNSNSNIPYPSSDTLLIDVEDTYSFRNLEDKIPDSLMKRMAHGSLLASIINPICLNGTGGQCYGMALTAASSNVYHFPQVGSYCYESDKANTLWDVQPNWKSDETLQTASNLIKIAYLYQHYPNAELERQKNMDDLDGFVSAVKYYLMHNDKPVLLDIKQYRKGDGHAVWPIGIGADTDKETEIIVYDCNHPGERCVVHMFKENGKYTGWEYQLFDEEGWTWGTKNSKYNAITYETESVSKFIDVWNNKLQYNFDETGYSRVLFSSSDAINMSTSTYSGTLHSINENDESFLPITTSSGTREHEQDNGAVAYWIKDTSEIKFSNADGAETETIGIASLTEKTAVALPGGATSELAVHDDGTSSAKISADERSEFMIEHTQENEDGSLSTVKISGAAEDLQTEKSGETILVHAEGNSKLTVQALEDDVPSSTIQLSSAVSDVLIQYVDEELSAYTDNNGDGIYETEISAANPFTDVPSDQYYYAPVLWAVNHVPQITNGTSPTTFSPDATCTRGQVVTFLWRAKGCPEPKSTKNPFSDVPTGAYYYKAVLWANENGITNGTSKTTFSPDAPCTRAHVVTFLWRAENKPAAGKQNPFTDVPAGQYFTDAVLWAVSKNITNGTSANTFSPDNPCTRGQIVTFLYRDMK